MLAPSNIRNNKNNSNDNVNSQSQHKTSRGLYGGSSIYTEEGDDHEDIQVKNKGKGGQLLAKTVKNFGAPREKRGEIWYELSGARRLEENSTESYERLVERAKEEDEREAPSSGRGHSIAKNKGNTNNTKSDESDDDMAYNARDGSKRSQVDRKRAKEEWAMQIDLDVDRTFPENDIFWTL